MIRSLFDTFRAAMMHKPKGSRKEAMDYFIEQVKAEPEYFDMLAREYFERMSATWVVQEQPLGHSFGRTGVSLDKAERTRAALVTRAQAAASPVVVTPEAVADARDKSKKAKERTQAAFEDLKAKVRSVILLDLTMPDGKPLRNATGAECKKAGGFYSEIAKHLKPTQVVDLHLSEGDLQNIRARFFQKNAA